MTTATISQLPPKTQAARALLVGGLVAGVLDISAAIVSSATRGVPAARVLQSVASGLLGRAAYEGGAGTAFLGLLLHFSIAFAATGIFILLSRRFKFLVESPWLWGPIYGVAVHLTMAHLVLPLSAFPHASGGFSIKNILIHITCVGLPIALAARRYSGRPPTTQESGGTSQEQARAMPAAANTNVPQ